MTRKVGICLVFLSFLFVVFIVNSSADIYSWVDEKGVTHYSSTPPKSDTELEVKIHPTTKPAKTNTPPPAEKNPIENIKSTLKSVVTPAPPKEQSQKPKVELYITSWCPWCQKAISFFQSKNVELLIYDVEQNEEAAKRKNQLDSQKGVPFAVINGKHFIHGYSEESYNNALKK